jgi:integrase
LNLPNKLDEPPVLRNRLHDLRRTYASLALREGVPVEVVSKRCGHADVTTMRIYRHADAEEHKKALLTLDELINGRLKG